MSSIPNSSISIQTSPQTLASVPCWFAEVTLVAHFLKSRGTLQKVEHQVRFARPRFGRYEVIDFVAVLLSYGLSGEPSIEVFYQRVRPFANALMALFGRQRLPHRSTLSRFLASLPPTAVEALRALFLQDLLTPPLAPASLGGLWDRQHKQWLVFDVDGTRQTARQRALPHGPHLPQAHRRFEHSCAPGYRGRKRGEALRTRSVVQQAHTHQWLATFGGAGNGDYRGELKRAGDAIKEYLHAYAMSEQQAVVRLDRLYGSVGVLACLQGLPYLTRGTDYHLLDQQSVQARLHLPPTQDFTHPETGLTRTLYDCPDLPVTVMGEAYRVIVATHLASSHPPSVGVRREGVVYELFLTTLPVRSFSASDVVTLYLHRGAFETTLADEDHEQDPDRWCSHSPWGQEFWQILSQWIWNLRHLLGEHLAPAEVRTTEFAPALPLAPQIQRIKQPRQPHFGPPELVQLSRRGCLPANAFEWQDDGTLRCPEGHPLYRQDKRREKGGNLRVLYGARISDCRGCQQRERCQGVGSQERGPRQVSAILHPRPAVPRSVKGFDGKTGTAALLWQDWSRCAGRQHWIRWLRSQRVDVQTTAVAPSSLPTDASPLSRAQRAHWRLSWEQRRVRNVESASSGSGVQVMVFGVPAALAAFLNLAST